jgi:putative hydrolase of the HAD superfamily
VAIRAITFDWWCTLFRDAAGEERMALRAGALADAAGVSRERAEDALHAVARAFHAHHVEHQVTLRPSDAVRIACGVLESRLDDATAADLADRFATAILAHSPVPIEGALEAVEAAAARFPVGVISDSGLSPGASLRKLLDRHGFTPHFAVLIFSDEAGVSKPQPKVYHQAAAALGVEPYQLLHIGDLERTDVLGAHQVGARAALFAGDNRRHIDDTRADYVLHNWAEFMELLPEL